MGIQRKGTRTSTLAAVHVRRLVGITNTNPVLRTSVILWQYYLICSNAVDHDKLFLLLQTEDVSSARVWGNTYQHLYVYMLKGCNCSRFLAQHQVCSNLRGCLVHFLRFGPIRAMLLRLNFLFFFWQSEPFVHNIILFKNGPSLWLHLIFFVLLSNELQNPKWSASGAESANLIPSIQNISWTMSPRDSPFVLAPSSVILPVYWNSLKHLLHADGIHIHPPSLPCPRSPWKKMARAVPFPQRLVILFYSGHCYLFTV